jgi:hypothetical protein
MIDLDSLRLDCPTLEGFSEALTRIQQALPPELRPHFREILGSYFLSFDIDGMYERLNNRTVAQIFAEYKPGEPQVLASGEVDGVRYQLSEPARPPSKKEDSKSDE